MLVLFLCQMGSFMSLMMEQIMLAALHISIMSE